MHLPEWPLTPNNGRSWSARSQRRIRRRSTSVSTKPAGLSCPRDGARNSGGGLLTPARTCAITIPRLRFVRVALEYATAVTIAAGTAIFGEPLLDEVWLWLPESD